MDHFESEGIPARRKLHYGWIVAAVAFAALLVAAGIRSLPGVLMLPLEQEFGWERSGISAAVSINLVLYGLMGPFAAASLEKFGVRKMMVTALALLATGLSLSAAMTSLWQLTLLWGVVIGLGTSVMANVLGVTVANRWFAKRKGLVVGILTASAATGQLLFLPLLAKLATDAGWRYAVWAAVAALIVMIAVSVKWMRGHPAELGLPPYGSDELVRPVPFRGSLFVQPLLALCSVLKSGTFWLLAGSFFICGFTTNGLIGTHLIAACGDFGIPEVTAAGMLAFMGVFDLVGTTLSGWLSDRFDSRWLLFWYYSLRGLSLLFLPAALDMGYTELTLFSVFYGLDWIATVPPTVKIASDRFGSAQAGIVFGWIVAAHQLGAAAAAFGAGLLRESLGSYDVAFMIAGFVCMAAALMSVRIRRRSQAASGDVTAA